MSSDFIPFDDEPVYGARPIKRRATRKGRPTRTEVQEREAFLIAYAEARGPVTVRGLYYQAEVAGVAGIGKDNLGYRKVQYLVLNLRRADRLSYYDIADATRWMRKPTTYDGPEAALANTARLYRKALWTDTRNYVEVWCEKDALAGVIYPVTKEYDVPLMVARGFPSETFCFEAIDARGDDKRDFHVCTLFDFDRAGQDAGRSLERKLRRFAKEKGIKVYFHNLAVTKKQVEQWDLPTREPKRKSAADKKWPHDFCCELDAIPPDRLRDLVRSAIEQHLPRDQLEILKVAEESERELLKAWCSDLAPEEPEAP
jgi:hypothetical protein